MQASSLDLSSYRRFFPALSQTVQDYPVVYFDNPGGTQVPSAVIDAFTAYLTRANANTGGAFANSRRTDAILAEARAAMADFLNADPDEIIFGANMTTLTFAISRALGRVFQPGDEILVTTSITMPISPPGWPCVKTMSSCNSPTSNRPPARSIWMICIARFRRAPNSSPLAMPPMRWAPSTI